MARILGIDPGNKGAFVLLNGEKVDYFAMPLEPEGVSFLKVLSIIKGVSPGHVFLERAMPFAMGTKSAFTYGRGFAALEIAIKLSKSKVTYVEPSKWTKALFAGIDTRLKPKERGRIALERLFPHLLKKLPTDTKGFVHEGVQDALLIAEYGRRLLEGEIDGTKKNK